MTDNIFHNRYRIPSARAGWHNYNGGTYFVTVCTQNREHYFGEIEYNANDEPTMYMSEIGKIADDCIAQMDSLHNDIFVPLWTVMPNHIHLLVIVESAGHPVETPYYDVSTILQPIQTPYYNVPTEIEQTNNLLNPVKNEKMQMISNQCGRLSHVISRFKTAVTKYARRNNIPFVWQPRFHDHIVRNTTELNDISLYIERNVAQWAYDELNDNTAYRDAIV